MTNTTLNIITPNRGFKYLADPETEFRLAEQMLEQAKRAGKRKPATPFTPTITPPTSAEYQFLVGDFGKDIDAEIQRTYPNIPVIQKVTYNPEKKVVIGSTPFYVIAVNEILRKSGLRTATQADLEKIISGNILPLKDNHWEDSALVLRTEEAPNQYLAQHLATQLKSRNFNQYSNANPLVIWLNQLELEKDKSSPHKLSFKLTDETQPFYSPVLSSDCNFSNTDSNGIPIKNENGNRTSWTSENGFRGLCLNTDLDVLSDYDYLDYSDGDARVVVGRRSASGVASRGCNIQEEEEK